MLIGSKAIEIYPWSSINGPTSWDGNLSIQLHSSEQDSSFGKKVTLLMLPSKKPKDKCLIILNFIRRFINSYWLSLFAKELRPNLKSSLEAWLHRPSKLGSLKMVELSKPQHHTISGRTLPRCTAYNLKTKRNKKKWSGRQVGDWQRDQLVLWQCTMETAMA